MKTQFTEQSERKLHARTNPERAQEISKKSTSVYARDLPTPLYSLQHLALSLSP